MKPIYENAVLKCEMLALGGSGKQIEHCCLAEAPQHKDITLQERMFIHRPHSRRLHKINFTAPGSPTGFLQITDPGQDGHVCTARSVLGLSTPLSKPRNKQNYEIYYNCADIASGGGLGGRDCTTKLRKCMGAHTFFPL